MDSVGCNTPACCRAGNRYAMQAPGGQQVLAPNNCTYGSIRGAKPELKFPGLWLFSKSEWQLHKVGVLRTAPVAIALALYVAWGAHKGDVEGLDTPGSGM